ncbi:MAG: ATP-dependent Clp protease proteolytic subunit [Pirellulales bacterium]|jgi:ATP-dependent protease ClpP protease subunit|nr:ATP-dependent Clp protease proteolytic subunit [Pirellulales bacterium]
MDRRRRTELVEIAVTGELTQSEQEICQRLLDVPPGGACVLYFNSPGGSSYTGLALMSLLLFRDLNATAVVTGECSSAALWPFAACRRRLVTPHSVLLFHPIRWESAERVGLAEAAEWARHFGELEADMDRLLVELLGGPPETIYGWIQAHRHVSGRELAQAGLAELVELATLPLFGPDTVVSPSRRTNSSSRARRQRAGLP